MKRVDHYRSARLGSVRSILLYCLLIAAPILLGSNRPIFWAINGSVSALILVIFATGELLGERRNDINWRWAGIAAMAITAWAVWLVIQATSLTPDWLHHPIWHQLADDLPRAAGAISISPSATWTAITQVVPISFLAIVAFRLGASHSRARFLAGLIVAIAVALASYGMAAQFLGLRQAFLSSEPADEGVLTATFVGRGAVAAYFVIGLCCAVSLVAAEFQSRERSGAGWIADAARILRRTGLNLGACVVLVAAIFSTGSRGGVIAAALGVLVVGAISFRRTSTDRKLFAGVAGIVVVALTGAGALSSDLLLQRLQEGISSRERLDVYADTIGMILARPWLGQGGGTFAEAFPLFHDRASSQGVWLEAHDLYLQTAAELGLPVAIGLFAVVVALLIALYRGLQSSAGPRPVATAAIAVAMAMAVQSLVDFPLQIQAVGMTVIVLFGAGLGEVVIHRALTPPPPDKRESESGTGGRLVRASVTITPAGAAATDRSPSSVGPNRRVYVFGDVHGRFDLLSDLKAAILRDIERSPIERVTVVGLGDYIDRGPRSNDVLEALASGFFEHETVTVRGNHEQMLIDFLEKPETEGPRWLRNGALETMRSYGIDAPLSIASNQALRLVRDEIARKMPPSHVVLLQRMPMSYEVGDYYFSHAGANPAVPLIRQQVHDLMWSGQAAKDETVFEKVIVHGHIAVDKPYLGQFRINLDTGAYVTGRLTCLVLQGVTRRLLDNHSDAKVR